MNTKKFLIALPLAIALGLEVVAPVGEGQHPHTEKEVILAPGCPTHSRVSNVWDQESVELLALPLIPRAGMSEAPALFLVMATQEISGLPFLCWVPDVQNFNGIVLGAVGDDMRQAPLQ
jgi:hypothetical protein